MAKLYSRSMLVTFLHWMSERERSGVVQVRHIKMGQQWECFGTSNAPRELEKKRTQYFSLVLLVIQNLQIIGNRST